MDSTRRKEKLVKCPTCHKIIYDGRVLKSRVTDFDAEPARAKCPGCKGWVEVPTLRRAM